MKFYYLLLFFALTIFSCKSAKEKLNDKDYLGAYDAALKGLKKGKDERENASILRRALTRLYTEYRQKSEKYDQVPLDQKSKITDQSITILDQFERAAPYIKIDSIYNVEKLRKETATYKTETGQEYMDLVREGLSQLRSKGDKRLAPDLLSYLTYVEKYLGLSNDVSNIKNELYSLGTININIVVDQWGYEFSNYELRRVFARLENESNAPLKKYYFDSNINSDKVDCQLKISLARPDNRQRTETYSRTYNDKVQDGYETKVDSKGNKTQVPKYKTITGSVQTTRYTTTLSSEVKTYMASPRGYCDQRDRYFTGNVESYYEDYRLSGDINAIPSQYRNGRSNQTKSESQMREELLADIYNKIVYEYVR